MSAQIRLANSQDASAIARIATQSDVALIDPASPRARRLLDSGRTVVATLNGEVVGFVDGFITIGPAGELRYELDLLGVAPAAQGCGIGGLLLAAAIGAAKAQEARCVRALVRCCNLPMERLCQRRGFERSSQRFDLRVANPQPVVPRKRHHAAHLVTVSTVAYVGVWLEGTLSQAAIDDACELAIKGGLSTLGALIPEAAIDAARLLERNAFRQVGVYRWWVITLRSDLF